MIDIAALKTAQIVALSTASIAALTVEQVGALSTADMVALSTAQAVALSTDQIVGLSTAQIAALGTANVAALTTAQVAAIELEDIVSLKTVQLVALSTNQLEAFSTLQAEAFTSTQIAAFTTEQLSHLNLSTPIVLDLNGDGVKTMSISSGVKFDIFADGTPVNTGWVSTGDGLLVLDRNHDGSIADGSELFGSSTTLTDGSKATDGYAALKELDTNKDGVISADDAAFADLQVWVDANSDGVSGAGELKTLTSLGITKIGTEAKVELSKDNGNLVGLVSTYETTDGTSHAAADVWFVADKYHANASSGATTVDDAIAALNSTLAQDTVNSKAPVELVTVTTQTATPMLTVVKDAPTSAQPTDLRTIVSSLARAIGTFDQADTGDDAFSAPGTGSPGSAADKASVPNLAVASMADVMKQFDSNGNLVGSNSTIASPTKALNLPGVQDSASKGFLAG